MTKCKMPGRLDADQSRHINMHMRLAHNSIRKYREGEHLQCKQIEYGLRTVDLYIAVR